MRLPLQLQRRQPELGDQLRLFIIGKFALKNHIWILNRKNLIYSKTECLQRTVIYTSIHLIKLI